MRDRHSNGIADIRTVRGEEAYVYAFKERAQRHHCLGYGIGSLDATEMIRLHRHYCRAIRTITYTSIYVKAVALAIQRHPEANAVLFRQPFGRRIVRFNQVDVNLPITRKLDDRWVTFIATVRNAAEKTLAEIQEELTEYHRCPVEQSFALRRMARFSRMPLWLARLVHWRMTWSPQFYLDNVGTCGVTFIEGDTFDHMLPIAPTSLVFGLGPVRREPVVRGREIGIAPRLKCSLMVDNYVISGLTGAAVARSFKELLESGSFIQAELASDPH